MSFSLFWWLVAVIVNDESIFKVNERERNVQLPTDALKYIS